MPRLDPGRLDPGSARTATPEPPKLSTATFSPTTEPVRLAFAVQSLLAAVLSLLAVFNVWSPTDAQVAAIMTVYAAILPVVGAVVRSRVTPVARVEAERNAAAAAPKS